MKVRESCDEPDITPHFAQPWFWPACSACQSYLDAKLTIVLVTSVLLSGEPERR